jgi:hypothetical protein
VEPYLLKTDIVQAEAVLVEPNQVAVQIVGVGVDGTGRGSKFRCQGIEPELGQPLIGPHEILLWEDPAPAPTSCQNSAATTCCDSRVRFPVGPRTGSPVLELDPIDEADQGGGIIIVEIVALAAPPERMDRPVAFDRHHDVLIRLGGGHDCSTENSVPMIRIMFHVSSIAIATSDRIGRYPP